MEGHGGGFIDRIPSMESTVPVQPWRNPVPVQPVENPRARTTRRKSPCPYTQVIIIVV